MFNTLRYGWCHGFGLTIRFKYGNRLSLRFSIDMFDMLGPVVQS